MKPRHVVCGALFLIPASGFASDDAKPAHSWAPYKAIYDQAEKLQQDIKGLPDMQMRFRVGSTLCGVTPAGIKLQITAPDGRTVPLPLDFSGDGTLPLLPALSQTDARITSNQPLHSLTFGMSISAVVPAQTSMHYRDLMQYRTDYMKAMKRQAGFFSWVVPSLHGLVLTYNSTAAASVTIATAGKPIVYVTQIPNGFHALPQSARYIRIPYDAALMQQNPLVTFSTRPASIDPLFPDWMEDKISTGSQQCKSGTPAKS